MKQAMIVLIVLLIALLMPCGSCSGTAIITDAVARGSNDDTIAQKNETAEVDTDLTDESRQVDELFSSFAKDDSPGGAVMVIEDGQILKESGYGLAEIESGVAITPHSLLHIGSVGKQFTAMGIMMLEEEGKIRFDDPIGKYLPELAWCSNDITIRHLLHHTSGITGYDEDDALYDELVDRPDSPTNQDLLAALARPRQMQFNPGDEFCYSNTGYDILGALIERVSGQSYPEFMQSRIFGPLSMTHTFAMPGSGREVCISYEQADGMLNPVKSDPLDDLSGSGSIYSSVEDLYLYDQALYTDKLVKQSTLEEAFLPAVLNDGSESKYGFGWELDPYNGEVLTAHSGSWLAFSSEYMRFPQKHLSIIVLLNQNYSEAGAEDLGHKIADIYLKEDSD